jgi:diguanylate cyclase (GGDEF)-like protein
MGLPSLSVETKDAQTPFGGQDPRPRLLIVDDIADNRTVLARRFMRRGFDIVEAEGGLQALALIEEQSFDVVLLDMMMPEIDGSEVLRRIRTRWSAAILPVIMVTANALSTAISESLGLGANDYITKPVDFSVALARVTNQVARRRAELELRGAHGTLENAKKLLEVQVVEAQSAIDDEIGRRTAGEHRIAYLAHHDTLTGLANRFSFDTELRSISSRGVKGYAVLFVDLDGFKNINDVLGHAVGDDLLKEIALRIRQTLHLDDFAARFGGDEFAILHVSQDIENSAAALARRLIDIISACQLVDGHQVFIGASVGIALAQGETVDPVTLLKRADLAMYRAKSSGRGRYRLFHPDMEASAQYRRSMELSLRAAVERGEFEMYYQPIVNLEPRRLAGFEALLRWKSTEHGFVSPAKFMDVAEDTGLIVPIGEWVLRQACAEAANWPTGLRVAVNLSAVQFRHKNLVSIVVSALATSGLPPERLELEITESVLLGTSSQTIDMLRQLRQLGVRISLDDFGAGYSGLGYLRLVQFDKIKIDQSFVRDMASASESLAIIRAAVSIGATLGISTTAEGVETAEQLRELSQEGCTEAQGFLLSVPQSANKVPEMVERVLQMSRSHGEGLLIGRSPIVWGTPRTQSIIGLFQDQRSNEKISRSA